MLQSSIHSLFSKGQVISYLKSKSWIEIKTPALGFPGAGLHIIMHRRKSRNTVFVFLYWPLMGFWSLAPASWKCLWASVPTLVSPQHHSNCRILLWNPIIEFTVYPDPTRSWAPEGPLYLQKTNIGRRQTNQNTKRDADIGNCNQEAPVLLHGQPTRMQQYDSCNTRLLAILAILVILCYLQYLQYS